jgi:hypothetical protein
MSCIYWSAGYTFAARGKGPGANGKFELPVAYPPRPVADYCSCQSERLLTDEVKTDPMSGNVVCGWTPVRARRPRHKHKSTAKKYRLTSLRQAHNNLRLIKAKRSRRLWQLTNRPLKGPGKTRIETFATNLTERR